MTKKHWIIKIPKTQKKFILQALRIISLLIMVSCLPALYIFIVCLDIQNHIEELLE